MNNWYMNEARYVYCYNDEEGAVERSNEIAMNLLKYYDRFIVMGKDEYCVLYCYQENGNKAVLSFIKSFDHWKVAISYFYYQN